MKSISKKRIVKTVMIIGLIGLGHVSGKLISLDLISGGSYLVYARFESVAGLETGETILETESLFDIGELIGQYTFGHLGKRDETVRFAHTQNNKIGNWVD